jgi:hypothetical protein
MKQRPRIYYSDSQKALMWERWKQGATLHQIAASTRRNRRSTQSTTACRVMRRPGSLPSRS